MGADFRSTSTDSESARPARHVILGTAGHIDHGKTTLIKTLTGIDTDRLPEERRRGMTIDLGFAELNCGEINFGIVDVPGHERFVRTMVAGATGIDVALIVVAADDSVMPQTVEHVEILDLLGVRKAVVALTKCDLVDTDLAELVEADARELLARTHLADAPIVRVAAVKKTGLDDLTAALVQTAASVTHTISDQPSRMPIDRVFTVAGRGTVVTGSVIAGRIKRGDTLDVWPVGVQGRVREVQTHGRVAEAACAGQRAAVNIQGVDKDVLTRGSELAAAGTLTPVRLIDARMTCLDSHARPIKNHSRVRLCLGTREVLARCVSLSGAAIEPGTQGYVQFRCAQPVTATFGQRFIIRDENAARTAGGGRVLRAAARRISHRMADEIEGLCQLDEGDDTARVSEVLRAVRFHAVADDHVAQAAGVASAAVGRITDQLVQTRALVELPETSRRFSAAYIDAFQRRALSWLRGYHEQRPDEPGCLLESFGGWLERKSDRTVGRALLGRLIDSGEVRVMGRFACLKEFAPSLSAQDDRILSMMLDAFHASAFQPPSAAELVAATQATRPRIQKLLKVACSTGQLMKVDGTIHLHADREQELRHMVRKLFETVGPFTVSELRETINTSRKYAVPIAEYLDRIAFTRRSGDRREVINAEKS